MKNLLFALVVGLVFGVGLIASGMTQPAKVVGFLDVLGPWDPSLGFVMGGAIGVHFLAYRLIPRLRKPLWGGSFGIPTRRDIDGRLIGGAVLFGAGWGLGGYCPGPALTSVVAGAQSTLLFTGAMLTGMWGHAVWQAAQATSMSAPSIPSRAQPASDQHSGAQTASREAS
jgi:uncharacterized protein